MTEKKEVMKEKQRVENIISQRLIQSFSLWLLIFLELSIDWFVIFIHSCLILPSCVPISRIDDITGHYPE